MAVTHAVKSFLDRNNVHVLVQTDNKTTLIYLNRMGGTVSNVCNKTALDLWTWCLQRNVVIKADFIPGRENLIANSESRHHADSSNWKFYPLIFKSLIDQTMKCNIVLFADRNNAKIPIYVSWLPDPLAIAFNAILHPWYNIKGYASPPPFA